MLKGRHFVAPKMVAIGMQLQVPRFLFSLSNFESINSLKSIFTNKLLNVTIFLATQNLNISQIVTTTTTAATTTTISTNNSSTSGTASSQFNSTTSNSNSTTETNNDSSN